MLASYVVLLVLAGVASMVGIGELLVIRLEDRTRDALDQEVLELRELLADRPDTSREARRTFDVYLDRNVPSQDEALLFFADGRPYRAELAQFPLDRLPRDLMDALVRHSLSPPPEGGVAEGDFDTPLGRGYYSAVPAGSAGVFVDAILPAAELREIDELQSAGFVVLAVIVALASLLAWMATQRAFRPLRDLSEAATAISDSDLSRRLPERGGTEEVEMARAFNSMLDRLEEVVRTQRDFLRRASHELRVPLTVGIGQLDVLAHAPEESDQAIAIVIEELTRGSRIVDELRLLTESDLPDFLRATPLELGKLSDGLIAKAVTLAPRQWVLEQRGEGEFAADGDRLTQAVMNLADNAANHTPDGGTIEIGSAADGDEVRLWVRDRGPGVPAAEQERIFEPFQRGTGAHRRYRGAGLGLAIVRAVAEAHGGRVELSARAGEGARFAIAIPRRPPGSAQGQT